VETRDVFLIFCDKKVALRRRPERGLLAGLWEFPHEPSPAPCPVPGRESETRRGKHIFTHVEWRMTAHVVQADCAALPQGWVWADRRELDETYPVPSAFSDFFPVIDRYL
jgi:A/G-specific adenine glycosylase